MIPLLLTSALGVADARCFDPEYCEGHWLTNPPGTLKELVPGGVACEQQYCLGEDGIFYSFETELPCSSDTLEGTPDFIVLAALTLLVVLFLAFLLSHVVYNTLHKWRDRRKPDLYRSQEDTRKW